MIEKPYVVACNPAYNDERTIGGVVVRAWSVDWGVVCVDGSRDLRAEYLSYGDLN